MVQTDLKKIVILCGPTASGKSGLALDLARGFGMEIVNADSQQVWRGLDIGTAKPLPADRALVPHHLIDVASPGESFNVSQFVARADAAIEAIVARGKKVLVVGGTGMYLRILLQGLCEAPPQDPTLRHALMAKVQDGELPLLFEELKKADPELAAKLHPQDTTRIVRGLEVYRLTGMPLTRFHRQHKKATLRYEALQIVLHEEKDVLGKRIEERVEAMMSQGWLEEVRCLLKEYSPKCQALQAIGYKQLAMHLQGGLTLDEAVAEIKKVTKAFAKRQLTWFRKNPELLWVASSDKDGVAKAIEKFYGGDL